MSEQESIEKLRNENAKQHEREKTLVAEIQRLNRGQHRPIFIRMGATLIRPEAIHTVMLTSQQGSAGSWINGSIQSTVHPLDLMKLIGAEVIAVPDTE